MTRTLKGSWTDGNFAKTQVDVDAWIQSAGVGNMKVYISLEMLHLFLRLFPDALKSTHLLFISHLRVLYVEETREMLSEEQTNGISGHLFGGLENALSRLHFHCWDKPSWLRWLIKEITSLGSRLQRVRRWSASRETEGTPGNAFVFWNLRVHPRDTPPTWPHFLILPSIGAWIFKHVSHGGYSQVIIFFIFFLPNDDKFFHFVFSGTLCILLSPPNNIFLGI